LIVNLTTDDLLGSIAPTSRSVIDVASLLDSLQQQEGSFYESSTTAALPLGFEPLDRVLGGGLKTHDLLVLAGRPGVGKTILTLQMARNLALGGATVVFACYEHSPVALLTRLITLEIGSIELPTTSQWYRVDGVRALLAEVASGRVSLASASLDPLLRAALANVNEYAHRLHLVHARPSETGLDELHNILQRVQDGPTILFVDYLQKVRAANAATTHLEHVAQVTAGLKEASLESSFSVVAVSAISTAGLQRRRTHLAHLDAAVAVGYDSDVVLMLNDKRPIVAPNQIMNTLEQSERLRQRVVFTIEKNRGGVAPVSLEFVKDFEHFRFDPRGSHVSEQLIEDGEQEDFRD
jgi:replicative DNA helicase